MLYNGHMTNPEQPLHNTRQERFVQAVATGVSVVAAYVEAGYSAKTAKANAYRLLDDQTVTARLDHLKNLAADASVMTANEVLVELSEVARNGSSTRDRLTALTALGKYYGLFTDRIDHTSAGERVEAGVHIYLPDNGRDPNLTN